MRHVLAYVVPGPNLCFGTDKDISVMNERFIVICNFLVVFIFNWVHFGHLVYAVLLDIKRINC